MKHFFKIIILLILLLVVPIGFASENLTDDYTISISDNDEILSSDVYFDSSSSVDGNGSQSNPYNHLDSRRLTDNSIAHFADGEYTLDGTKSFYNLTIIGQSPLNTIIKSDLYQLRSQDTLNIYNITLDGVSICNYKNFNAYGVVFENCSGAYKGSYSNVFGGAVYSTGGNVLIDSSSFKGNTALYGGALYATGSNVKIINSTFENNYAGKYGGAIASEEGSVLEITDSSFVNCYSLNNAGGAIYSKESSLNVKKSNFSSCNATFGGAICDLSSNSNIDSIIASNNNAKSQGGAIYKMYGQMTLTSSSFTSNKASSGGAVFADNSSEISIKLSKFNSNEAINEGGAIYTILNTNETVSSNTYSNNKASTGKDHYESTGYNLVIGNGNYIQYVGDFSSIQELPSRYDLRDYNEVTPVKHQQSSGNCWAFNSLAVLESCILKVSGESLDLSEENMKNIMAYYSDYGWILETNKGGYDDMGVGYLVSWLGTIGNELESYSDHTVLSPVVNSSIHVQNLVYLTRTNYTDNDAVKEAIMKYGAVTTGIYYSSSYLKSNSYYYSGTTGPNHAITIVGWDDNYSKSNFKNTPLGDGAWICKNSWGETWGDKGYFYVSYYDINCVRIGGYDKSSYTFILNDTNHYDKNYQYDIIGITDYLITGKNESWYQNIFKATGNELLTAFSTYFNTTTNWTAQVYVNDDLKLTQDGAASAGYYTFNLNEKIPLKTGDTFKIVLKISTDKLASIPVSEKIRSNRVLYSKGTSFFSFDGKDWIDLYDFNESMPEYGHSYESQVACIKAFTTYYSTSSIVLNSPKFVDINTPFEAVATVSDGEGNPINSGMVTFTIDSRIYNITVKNGKATLTTKLYSNGNYTLSAKYNGKNLYSNSSTAKLIKTNVGDTNLTLEISDVNYGDELIIKNTLLSSGSEVLANIDVKIGQKTYTLVSNSESKITDIFVPGKYTAVGSYSNIASANATFNVNKAPLTMNLTIVKTDDLGVNITVEFSKALNESVEVKVNSKPYNVKTTNGVGTLILNDLDYGNYTVESSFSSPYYQNASANAAFSIDVMKTNLIADNLEMFYHDGSRFYVTLKDINNNPLSNQNIVIKLNGVDNKRTTKDDGSTSIAINLDSGLYEVVVTYSGEGIYLNSSVSRNITVKSTVISSDVVKYHRNGTQYYATILDNKGNIVVDATVEMNINGVLYHRKTNEQGVVKLNINLEPKTYILTLKNPITGELKSNNITVLPRIVENYDLVKYYKNASKYSVKLLDEKGSPLAGASVSFNINGVFYTRTTNSDGIASLNINLRPGTYIITAFYGESVVSNSITVLSVIESEDIVMKYRDGTKFKVTILDGQGNPYPNQSIAFNINGVMYSRVTNATGGASLNINLQPGKYIITSMYNDLSVANTIEIKSA
ncbi:C1 family peptidase [Methanobrevibacter sp.]|uniref:C1 family peptidase n=1 Tax=Methanobrevibacter sp. TaxID=66852 RepID=UPI00388EA73E